MNKILQTAMVAFYLFITLLPVSCGHEGGDDNDGGNGGGDDSLTYIQFKNLEIFPVRVFTNPTREEGAEIAALEAQSASESIKWLSGNYGFYLKYDLNFAGVEVPYEGGDAYIYPRVDKDTTNNINIPPLSELLTDGEKNLTNNIYIKIKNSGNLSFTVQKASTILKPVNGESTVNGEETAAYEIKKASYDTAEDAASYKLAPSGTGAVAFPVPEFEKSKLYTFEYNGTALIFESVIPLTYKQAVESDALTSTWQKLYGKSGKQWGFSCAACYSSGGIYCGGYTDAGKAAVFSFNTLGELIKCYETDASADDSAVIAAGVSDNLFYALAAQDPGYKILTSGAAESHPVPCYFAIESAALYPCAMFFDNGCFYVSGITSDARFFIVRHKNDTAKTIEDKDKKTFAASAVYSPQEVSAFNIQGAAEAGGLIIFYGSVERAVDNLEVAFACAYNFEKGTIEWKRLYEIGGAVENVFYTHFYDGSSVALAGESTLTGYTGYAVKIKSGDGSAEWQLYASGTDLRFNSGLTVEDGYVFAGTASGGHGGSDVYLAKYPLNCNGTTPPVWQKFFGGAGDDEGNVLVRSGSNFVIAGRSENEAFIIKTKLNGEI